jgi:hypothetical protein
MGGYGGHLASRNKEAVHTGCTKSISTNAQYALQQKVGPISINESFIF